MLQAHLDQSTHVIVVQGIKHISTAPLRPDEAKSAEQPELMGNVRLAEAEQRAKITDAERPGARERLQNPQTVRLTECREYLA
jgi:hypothetical protein